MKCQTCPSPATLHITEIVKGVAAEHHFCEECAKQYLAQAEEKGSEVPPGPAAEESRDTKLNELDHLVCPNCGITFKEFRKQGRLGCPHDYIAFQAELLPLLETIHGETQHFGKVPKRTPDDSQKQYQLMKLRGKLKLAIAEESYELAAKLRDEIQQMERETATPPSESEAK